MFRQILPEAGSPPWVPSGSLVLGGLAGQAALPSEAVLVWFVIPASWWEQLPGPIPQLKRCFAQRAVPVPCPYSMEGAVGLPVLSLAQDVRHRAMATCHTVQSEQPDSPGNALHPLLTFPGGSSFQPWTQFKNILAWCLLKSSYCRREQRHGPSAGMLSVPSPLHRQLLLLVGPSWISELPSLQAAANGSGGSDTSALLISIWSAGESRLSNQDRPWRDLGGSSALASCRQFGLMDLLAGADAGLLRTNSFVCRAPAWEHFGSGWMGNAVVMDGQCPTSHGLLWKVNQVLKKVIQVLKKVKVKICFGVEYWVISQTLFSAGKRECWWI